MIQMLHHLNQPITAPISNSRAKPPADSKTAGIFSSRFSLVIHLQLHDLGAPLRFRAIDRQHHRAFRNDRRISADQVKRHDPIRRALFAKAQNLLQGSLTFRPAMKEDPRNA